ncbi:hypothetical protein FBU31_004670, partial [Coemansia sp. 'formosensis']
ARRAAPIGQVRQTEDVDMREIVQPGGSSKTKRPFESACLRRSGVKGGGTDPPRPLRGGGAERGPQYPSLLTERRRRRQIGTMPLFFVP